MRGAFEPLRAALLCLLRYVLRFAEPTISTGGGLPAGESPVQKTSPVRVNNVIPAKAGIHANHLRCARGGVGVKADVPTMRAI